MDNVVRGCNWYWDTLNAYRVLDEVELPDLKNAVDPWVSAGHHMSVEWPEEMEPLAAEIKHRTNDPQVRGLYGRQPPNYTTSTYYENLESYLPGGQPKGRMILLRGLVNGVKQDTVRGVKRSGVTHRFSTLIDYQDVFDGRIIHRFSFFGGPGQTLVNGENPFAAMARNLAIGGGIVL